MRVCFPAVTGSCRRSVFGSDNSKQGTVVGSDAVRDLAVVRICCDTSWKPLPTSGSVAPWVGSRVSALVMRSTNQFGRIDPTLATGLVTWVVFHEKSRSWLIRTDVEAGPGHPLMDSVGRVIGIVSSSVYGTGNAQDGVAISMQTVDDELDLLQKGRHMAGWLSHDADEKSRGCAYDLDSHAVISRGTVDSAVFLRFEVPQVDKWSLGFLYHGDDDDSDTATYIWSERPGFFYLSHGVRSRGQYVNQLPDEPIASKTFRTRPGALNELAFRTSSKGTYVRLNDDFVFDIPAEYLIREPGTSRICVGLRGSTIETESYSIRYADISMPFEHEAVSRVFMKSGTTSRTAICSTDGPENDNLTLGTINSWAIMDFITPDVQNWSIGINGMKFGKVDNIRVAGTGNQLLPTSILRTGRNFRVVLEFGASVAGSWLRLNGRELIWVDRTDSQRSFGATRVCINVAGSNENRAYSVRFTDIWVWRR